MNRDRRDNLAAVGLLAAAVVFVGAAAVWMDGGDVPVGDRIPPGYVEERLAGDLDGAVALAVTAGGTVLVGLEGGEVVAVAPGDPEPVVVTVVPGGGLTGLAVAPDFEETGHLYVAHAADGLRRVSRFTVDAATGRAGPEAAEVVVDLPAPPGGPANPVVLAAAAGGAVFVGAGPEVMRFEGQAGELWATGLDRVLALAVDPESGRAYAAHSDGAITELHELAPGTDYGSADPVYAYGLDQGCGVGGVGVLFSGLVVVDACFGWIRGVAPDTGQVVALGEVAERAAVGLATREADIYYLTRPSEGRPGALYVFARPT